MNYRELNGISIREGFDKFNADNPHIYNLFEREVLKAIQMGRKKISGKLVINWIRWNELVTTNDKSFKINDAYHSYYSRYFVKQYPKYAGVFNMRKLRNEEGGQYVKYEGNKIISFL